MTPAQLKRFREDKEFSQDQLAELINVPLERRYNGRTISGWENGNRAIPAHVSAYLDALALDGATSRTEPEAPQDTPPAGADFAPTMPISSSTVYAKACEDLWEMVAMGVGLTGAALDNERVKKDGAIISGDKVALGRAYGKLAETNETFRRMLVSMTSGGAWMEVAFVTGTTIGKMYANHVEPRTEDLHDGLRVPSAAVTGNGEAPSVAFG